MENEDRDDLPIIPENCLEQDYNSQINISDVIEVIQTTDPVTATAMFNNGGELHQPQSQQQQQQQQAQQQQQQQQQQLQQPQPPIPSQNGPSFNNSPKHNAYVEITEQPAPKAIRFRYECEGRSAGSIPGVNFTADNKTFPSIKVVGYKGRAVVVVSCVTKDPPYRPHPHRLVGKEGCKKGVCTVEINSETMSVTFSNLGIQCVKRKDIEGALLLREEIRVDPYRTGFPHRDQPSTIDLNAVRLCFQVFLESDNRPRFSIPLAPVVSDPIYDKKGTNDLTICKLSDCSSSCAGGKEIILLCEKVAKEDIKVRFFERKDGIVVWDAYGDFNHTNVHKQVAISFKVPRYKSLDITQTVKVFIQLKRPSDDVVSEALPFDYLPLDAGLDAIGNKRKRQVVGGDARSHVNRYYQIHEKRNQQKQEPIPGPSSSAYLNIPTDQTIKTEPRDTSPTPYLYGGGSLLQIGNYRVPQGSPSPQSLSPATPTPGYFNQPSPTYNNMAMPQTILQNFGGNDITGGNTMNMSPILNPFQNNNYQNIGGGGNNNSLNPLLPSLDTLQNHWNLPTNNILNNINNNDYNNKQQQQQQQQQHHQQQQQQQQQNNLNLNPFHDNYNDPTINLNQNTIKDNNNININIGDTIITNSNIFLDLDSHQVNSSELANIYQQIPSLLDVKQEQSILMEQEEQNMTDSFNKLSTSTINGIAVLNTYKRKNDNL